MDVNAMYPSEYLKASDLQGKDHTVTIQGIKMEKIGRDDEPAKPVLYFRGAKKGLVLNRTNANTVAEIYGTETNFWMGKPITLGVSWVDFQGRQVEAIRVRPQMRETGQAPKGGANVLPNAAAPAPAATTDDPLNPDGAPPFDDALPDNYPGNDPAF